MPTNVKADIRVGLIISIFNIQIEVFDLIEKEINARPVGTLRTILNDAMLYNAYDRLIKLSADNKLKEADQEELDYFVATANAFLAFDGKDYLSFMMEVRNNSAKYRKELLDLGFTDGSGS